MQEMDRMMQAWGDVWQEDYELKMAKDPKVIQFQEENKYKEMQDVDLVAIAKELIEQCKAQEAILCLEAEVQNNKQNSQAWRILGQLYQENDQDDFAILAFKEAHECDPYDLDSLLALGISFTNEFEDMEAFRYLHSWLKYHPDYSHISNIQDGQKLDFNEI